MQTLNMPDNQFSEFNAFRVFDSVALENNKRGIALLEQLQTSLDIERILNAFAMEASKYIDFSGLSLKNKHLTKTIRGSRKGKKERRFELKINNELIGVLTYSINSPISITNAKILQELHQFLIYPLRNAIQYHQALQLAMQDPLTGLGNRRYFDDQIKRAVHHANRKHNLIGLMVCDINKFKTINDSFGHFVGDEILKSFADALRHCIRDSDSLFRFGGDEFVVLVEDISSLSLDVIEHRINHAIANDKLLCKYQVSCSLGTSVIDKNDDENSLFTRADKAMYRKKMINNKKLKLV